MPWTATKAFPHPLANIRPSSQDVGLINYVSYTVVETVLWQGLGSVINKFRDKVLGLEPLRLAFGSRIANRLKIFHTYCWWVIPQGFVSKRNLISFLGPLL